MKDSGDVMLAIAGLLQEAHDHKSSFFYDARIYSPAIERDATGAVVRTELAMEFQTFEWGRFVVTVRQEMNK